MTDYIIKSMKSMTEERNPNYTVSEDEDIALKSDIDDYETPIRDHILEEKEQDIDEFDDTASSATVTTTCTTTITNVTTTSQKFIRLRGDNNNHNTTTKARRVSSNSNKKNMYIRNHRIPQNINEFESELTQTEMTGITQTGMTQLDMTEMTEMTELTEMTQTEMTEFTKTINNESTINESTTMGTMDTIQHKKIIVVADGDEIKCCNKIDIYTGLYIIFGYNIFIGLLLILIIIWSFQLTDIAYIITVWAVLFLLIRAYISIFGLILIPRMVGLHGDEIRFLKQRYLKGIQIWSVFLLYGPILFNVILIIGFIIYSVMLGLIIENGDNGTSDQTQFGQVTAFQNVDPFTAKFLLFCMGFIAVIVIIDTICEVMFYDTIKKFMPIIRSEFNEIVLESNGQQTNQDCISVKFFT